MDSIKKLYFKKYKKIKFYNLFQNKVKEINQKLDLKFQVSAICENTNADILCKENNIRVDLPIWHGSIESEIRVMILGLEPRHTHDKFNIDQFNQYVFGSPFGIEYWTLRNPYYKAFHSIIKRKNTFVYFSDVVKEYFVYLNKENSDKSARKNFSQLANDLDNIKFLEQEINIIKPTHILGVGDESFNFLNKQFGNNWNVFKIRHPAARPINKIEAPKISNNQIQKIFNNGRN